MEANVHTMSSLFDQLGLPADTASIDEFVSHHGPLDRGVSLCGAPFWSTAQRTFLKEEMIEDADWVGVIDELNVRLS